MSGVTSLRTAILFSSICHLLLLWGGSRWVPFQQVQVVDKTGRELQVFYSAGGFEGSQQGGKKGIEKEVPLTQERSREGAFFPSKSKEGGKEELRQADPVTSPQEEGNSFEKELIAELHLSGEEKPLYLAYYQELREKIRQSIRKHYSEGMLEGQVFLAFVVFANGQLKQVAASEKKPFQDRRLKGVALQSVMDAAPFPPFPEGLRRSFVPFRVAITFVGERKSFIGE